LTGFRAPGKSTLRFLLNSILYAGSPSATCGQPTVSGRWQVLHPATVFDEITSIIQQDPG
jgi:hypothetical protein